MSTVDRNLTGLHRRWGLSPSTLAPGCFASVMATGIVSIGAELAGWHLLSVGLLWLAVALYVFFTVLTVVRVLRYPDAVRADLHDPSRAFGFFTAVAGTNILGTGFVGLGMIPPALSLFILGGLLWLVLGYGIPFTAILGSHTRPVPAGVNGTWLVWAVAAQSVAVVAASLGIELPNTSDSAPGLVIFLVLTAVVMSAVGLSLYIVCVIAIIVRVLRHRFGPEDLDAPYWVTMGALAIAIVAGSRILDLGGTPLLEATRVLVGASSALLWAIATWLVPALVAAGIWRHAVHRVPMTYAAGLWSMVFPVGMYAVASIYLGRSDHVPAIEWIGQHWFWVSLAVWAIVFVAMVTSFIRTVRRP
ncbi:tellurite resistance/C4-dicarboxylate transporter family protein [Brevibacterium linens]|uniref:Tellurite resistance protein TehA n=1 Tax=Brevibacterium linens TaxID=1703 RepID=A0A2H1JXR2_BRELN|nr:tellurite resistance/C4-dicarboxylate transporter family protein [Brevibacterium linens]AZU01914.1 tellurite resistance protein permease [Brevibacterium linens]SMX92266.1 Tellurite resistance protein TehA [Brevibacterium linens]